MGLPQEDDVAISYWLSYFSQLGKQLSVSTTRPTEITDNKGFSDWGPGEENSLSLIADPKRLVDFSAPPHLEICMVKSGSILLKILF